MATTGLTFYTEQEILNKVYDSTNNQLRTSGSSIGATIGSGTSGSVLYVNSGGLLAQDNTNLFYDAVTKDLSIGGVYYNTVINSHEIVGCLRFTGTNGQRVGFTMAQGLTITNCADNGATLIRVTTVQAHGYSTGAQVVIAGVTGTTEANGNWVVTVVDANNFDLQGSLFTNAYVSGGSANAIIGTNSVTMSGVIMAPSSNPATFGGLIGVSTTTNTLNTTNNFFCYIGTNGTFNVKLNATSSANFRLFTLTNNFVTTYGGRVVHFAVVRNGAAVPSVFINGIAQAGTETTGGTPPTDWSQNIPGTNFVIGEYDGTNSFNQRLYRANLYSGITFAAADADLEMSFGVQNTNRWGSILSNTAGCILMADIENCDPANSTTVRDVSSNAYVGTANASPVQLEPVVQSNNSFIRIGNGVTRSGSSGLSSGFVVGNTGTYTDNATAASGTAASFAFYSFLQPTLAATNTSVTTTNAATVWINNAPAAGTNMTITNAYSLYAINGNVRFDAFLGLGLVPAAVLHVGGNRSAAAWTSSGIAMRLDGQTYTDTTSSGTVANVAINNIGGSTIAASSVTTYTVAATLRIGNAPAAGSNVTITNAYAILVASGKVRFDAGVVYNVALVTDTTGRSLNATQDSGFVLANTGAGSLVSYTLPASNIGTTYTFVVENANGIKVTAAASNTIRIAGSVSASAGNIQATAVGSTVTLVCVAANEWIATAVNGTWTVT